MAWQEIEPIVKRPGGMKGNFISITPYNKVCLGGMTQSMLGLAKEDYVGFVRNTETKCMYVFKQADTSNGYRAVKGKFGNMALAATLRSMYQLDPKKKHRLNVATTPVKYKGSDAFMLEKI